MNTNGHLSYNQGPRKTSFRLLGSPALVGFMFPALFLILITEQRLSTPFGICLSLNVCDPIGSSKPLHLSCALSSKRTSPLSRLSTLVPWSMMRPHPPRLYPSSLYQDMMLAIEWTTWFEIQEL